jgi:drug/metabolite transporter (DMT)-like permease
MMTNVSPFGNRRLALSPTLMLVTVTALWGLSFPLMKGWLEASRDCPGGQPVAGFTLIALRMFLGLIILALVQPRLFLGPSGREVRIGLFIGATFWLGFTLQVMGLAWTTPAQSAFITSLGSAWAPLLAWAWFRLAPSGFTFLGLGLGVAGTVVLGIADIQAGTWGLGEGLTVIASVIFAVEILLLDRLGRDIQSAHLTVPFFAITGLLALVGAAVSAARGPGIQAWLTWTSDVLREGQVAWDLGLLTLFSTVLAFHWMNVYQPRVGANRAALVYLLEPIFGTAISILLGRDSVTWQLVCGGSLILGGNLLVELPAWIGNGRQRNPL